MSATSATALCSHTRTLASNNLAVSCRKRSATQAELQGPKQKVVKTQVSHFLKAASEEMKSCEYLITLLMPAIEGNVNDGNGLHQRHWIASAVAVAQASSGVASQKYSSRCLSHQGSNLL